MSSAAGTVLPGHLCEKRWQPVVELDPKAEGKRERRRRAALSRGRHAEGYALDCDPSVVLIDNVSQMTDSIGHIKSFIFRLWVLQVFLYGYYKCFNDSLLLLQLF